MACPPPSSPTWIGLKKGVATFLNGSKWIAGRNSSFSLWFDKWMNKGTLRSQIQGPLNKGEEKLTLRDISYYLGWNWESLSFAFPKSLAFEMKATPLPFSNQGEDRLSWYSSPNGDFKLKEAYRLANWVDNNTARQEFKDDWVWKVATLSKIKCFLWQCCHQSISVRAILAQRGMDISFLCPMCNNAPETILHALRDYPKVQSLWNSLSPSFQSNLFMVCNWWIG